MGYRDGSLLQFFIRSFQTLDDQSGGADGAATNQGSLGARWKPLRDYNLVLTGERLISIGDLAIDNIHLIEPQDYLSFVYLMAGSSQCRYR